MTCPTCDECPECRGHGRDHDGTPCDRCTDGALVDITRMRYQLSYLRTSANGNDFANKHEILNAWIDLDNALDELKSVRAATVRKCAKVVRSLTTHTPEEWTFRADAIAHILALVDAQQPDDETP